MRIRAQRAGRTSITRASEDRSDARADHQGEPGGDERDDPQRRRRERRRGRVDPVDEKLRPQRLAEVDRPAERRRAAGDRAWRRRGSAASRCRTSSSTARPGLGKTTFATVLHNELGVELNITSGAGARQEDGRDALPDQRGRGLDPLHRRDPPPAQDGRGVHLPGDGGFPRRRRAGRGDVGPDDQPAAQEVHDHRRDDPQRHALRPAPRPVPHARAPRVLRRRRPGQDRHDQRRQAADDDHARGRLGARQPEPRHAPARQRPPPLGPRLRHSPAPTATITLSDRPRRPRHAGDRRRGAGQAGPPLPGDPDPRLPRRARPASRPSPRP